MTENTLLAPRLSSHDPDVEVVQWHVKDGGWIEAGEDLVDVATLKAVVTVAAETGGFVVRRAQVGDSIGAGRPLASVYAKKEDAEAALKSLPASQSQIVAESRSVKVSGAKQAEIERLTQGQSGNLTCTVSFHFSSAALRAKLGDSFHGMILPVILFELARLLPKYPAFCSYFADGRIHYYDRYDLGLAVDMGKGVKVVSLKNCHQLSQQEIYEKILDISLRYAQNLLTLEELSDSTITVSDVSGFNVMSFQPLINGKQSVILGIGGDKDLPGFPLTFNFTFDHRVLSGREVGLFATALRDRLNTHAPTTALTGTVVAADPMLSDSILEARCSRCFIDIRSYYQQFQSSALMQVCTGPDGLLVNVCHVCMAGS